MVPCVMRFSAAWPTEARPRAPVIVSIVSRAADTRSPVNTADSGHCPHCQHFSVFVTEGAILQGIGSNSEPTTDANGKPFAWVITGRASRRSPDTSAMTSSMAPSLREHPQRAHLRDNPNLIVRPDRRRLPLGHVHVRLIGRVAEPAGLEPERNFRRRGPPTGEVDAACETPANGGVGIGAEAL
jgi:hypothetical protein